MCTQGNSGCFPQRERRSKMARKRSKYEIWLGNAVLTDKTRETISRPWLENGDSVATDGHRMHIAFGQNLIREEEIINHPLYENLKSALSTNHVWAGSCDELRAAITHQMGYDVAIKIKQLVSELAELLPSLPSTNPAVRDTIETAAMLYKEHDKQSTIVYLSEAIKFTSFEIRVNFRYALQAIHGFTHERVTIKCDGSLDMVSFEIETNIGLCTALVMPCRPE